jgi:hypothetical protein
MAILKQEHVTPFVIGTFIFSAVTGGAMFFHLGSGLTADAHQWLGWAVVAAGVFHAIVNWQRVSKYLQGGSRYVVLAFAAITVAVLLPIWDRGEKAGSDGGKRQHPYAVASRALMRSPLETACLVAKKDVAAVVGRLAEQGIKVTDSKQSIMELGQNNKVDPVRVLVLVMQ